LRHIFCIDLPAEIREGRPLNCEFFSSNLLGMTINNHHPKPIRKKHIAALKRKGAVDVVEIAAETIEVGDWVAEKCKFGCPGYNQCLTCPPHTPTPADTRKILAGYRRALLVHFQHSTQSGSPWPSLRRIVVAAERALFLDGFEKAWGLAGGPCELCDECTMDECRYPEMARPAMEACGIDVFTTARAANLPIEVITSRDQTMNLYGLILVD